MMKKLISIFLMACILCSAITVFAEEEYTYKMNEELLENGGFEEGDETNFFLYGPACEIEVDGEYAHSGDYGMKISERSNQYSTWAYNVTDIITQCGPGKYKASVWVKLAEGSPCTSDITLVLNYKTSNSTNKYLTAKCALTDKWQQLTFEKDLEYDVETESVTMAYLYQQSFLSEDEAPDVLVDDFSLMKTTEINGKRPGTFIDPGSITLEHISLSGATRPEETTFGAIRWDAWYAHNGVEGSVISQVERSLSPAKFHWRAPFFAEVTDEGKITIPEYTQEIFDKEMEYAMDAGIDYFAYVWYDSDMKASRIFHTKSKYKNDVKMVACFDGNAIGKDYAREDMERLFKEDYYMTVLGGRPLMYYFGEANNMSNITADIKYYRALTKQLGIPEPFAVIMNVNSLKMHQAYGDAVSNYAVAGSNNEPFTKLMDKAYSTWENHRGIGNQYVPLVTFGWHAEPRYINQVSWTTVNNGHWADYATTENIYDHVSYALSYMEHPCVKEFTKANTLIAYAWNEHDEGGWMCPTLAVDENGNQLYNEDGSKKIDDSRVKAVKKALEDHKNGKRVEIMLNGISNLAPDATATPEATNAPDATNAPVTSEKGSVNPVFIIAPIGAVIVIAGVVAVIVIKKKKEK